MVSVSILNGREEDECHLHLCIRFYVVRAASGLSGNLQFEKTGKKLH